MSVVPASDDEWKADDSQLIAALVSKCHLSADAVRQIAEVMRASKLSFGEAALQMRLITPEQLQEALEQIQEPADEQKFSVVATSVRQFRGARNLIPQHDDHVTPSKRLRLAHDSSYGRGEKIRALRTELLLLSETGGDANFLALLSPQAHEGRSQLAAELAISFAQLGRRTLLVDADMRNPSQHALFDSDNRVGLAQALKSGGMPMLWGVRNLPFMSLLKAGRVPPNPLELLSHDRFELLSALWRDSYDFVILDTPPVAQYSDALIVAAIARRAVVLCRARQTYYKDMKDMLRRLTATQCSILGAVINKFDV
jgi:protein-tyrosine kinase